MNKDKNERVLALSEKIRPLVKPHLDKLLLKKKQLIRVDDYGNVDSCLFDKELNYFVNKNIRKKVLIFEPFKQLSPFKQLLESIGTQKIEENSERSNRYQLFIDNFNDSSIFEKLDAAGFSYVLPIIDGVKIIGLKVELPKVCLKAELLKDDDDLDLVLEIVRDLIFDYENNTLPKVKNLDDVSPIDFEHECADLLNESGWTARVTQASGDQGIDVIATYENVKAVFQVKKYSQPVGNSAVQEIIAGKAFEQAHVAAVVTNSTFTASAKKLANATGVFLLHYSELPDFAEELGLVETE